MTTSKKSTKKSTRRDKYQYSAVENSVNLRSRQDDIEDVNSYFDQLSDSEKEWMNKFMSEYNNAEGVADNDTEALHNTQELRKACRDRNNARNRCLYTQEKAQNRLKYVEKIEEFEKMNLDVFSKPIKKKRKK
jgi:hypothetical protein